MWGPLAGRVPRGAAARITQRAGRRSAGGLAAVVVLRTPYLHQGESLRPPNCLVSMMSVQPCKIGTRAGVMQGARIGRRYGWT